MENNDVNSEVLTKKTQITLDTVANAVELSTNVIMNVVGTDVSDQLNGETLTRAQLSRLLVARIQKKTAKAAA